MDLVWNLIPTCLGLLGIFGLLGGPPTTTATDDPI